MILERHNHELSAERDSSLRYLNLHMAAALVMLDAVVLLLGSAPGPSEVRRGSCMRTQHCRLESLTLKTRSSSSAMMKRVLHDWSSPAPQPDRLQVTANIARILLAKPPTCSSSRYCKRERYCLQSGRTDRSCRWARCLRGSISRLQRGPRMQPSSAHLIHPDSKASAPVPEIWCAGQKIQLRIHIYFWIRDIMPFSCVFACSMANSPVVCWLMLLSGHVDTLRAVPEA